MNPAQTVRISLLLAVIFGAGILTGRLTAPKPPVMLTTMMGRTLSSDGILTRMTRQLRLDAQQQEQMRTLVEESTDRMSQIPVGNPTRMEIFREYVPRMRNVLRNDQYPPFDRMVREAERRHEMNRRRLQREAATNAAPAKP